MKKQSILLDPRGTQAIADLMALVASFFAYQYARQAILGEAIPAFSVADTWLVGTVVAVIWMIVFWLGGLYRNYYVRSAFAEAVTVLRIVFVFSLISFLLIYADSPSDYQQNPRFVFILYWILVSGCITLGRLAARSMQKYWRSNGTIRVTALYVGDAQRVTELHTALSKGPPYGYHVLGMISTDDSTEAIVPVVGHVSNLEEILSEYRPAELLITTNHSNHDELLNVVVLGTDFGCRVNIVPDMYEIVSGQARTQQIYGTPLINVNPELIKPWEEFAKRSLDIGVSLVVLLVGLPLWIVFAIAVKLSSNGPALFSQVRVGRNGALFTMKKFRSMYVDHGGKTSWTTVNDPRVTKVGWFLRKTHLDEIPQLWNVLVGDMSLVGPRPELPNYVEKFTNMMPYFRRRLKVRPGITGWWQVKAVSGEESREEIESRLRYDFYYIENFSFMLDIEILVRTIFVMIKGHGVA